MLKHRVLFDEQTIAARVQEMARVIAQDLPEPTPGLIGPNTRVNIRALAADHVTVFVSFLPALTQLLL